MPNTVDAEEFRLREVEDIGQLTANSAPEINGLCEVARQIFDVPVSLVTVIDGHFQHFLGNAGLEGVSSTARDVAFCHYAIMGSEPMMVRDATRDPRFAHNPLVTGDMGIRFYAGVPIETQPGCRIGSFCVIDHVPRTLSDEQLALLAHLSRAAARIITCYQVQHRLRSIVAGFHRPEASDDQGAVWLI